MWAEDVDTHSAHTPHNDTLESLLHRLRKNRRITRRQDNHCEFVIVIESVPNTLDRGRVLGMKCRRNH
jgi:hypothetical protein